MATHKCVPDCLVCGEPLEKGQRAMYVGPCRVVEHRHDWQDEYERMFGAKVHREAYARPEGGQGARYLVCLNCWPQVLAALGGPHDLQDPRRRHVADQDLG